jgi:hypothetical protein
MNLDDCVEVIVNNLVEQDKEYSATLRQRFVDYYEHNIDVGDTEEELPHNFSLQDFSVIIREFEEDVSDVQLVSMFHTANARAHQRDIKLDDFVASARDGGILPLPVKIEVISSTISYRVLQALITGTSFNVFSRE